MSPIREKKQKTNNNFNTKSVFWLKKQNAEDSLDMSRIIALGCVNKK
jgi:hypothetical protein